MPIPDSIIAALTALPNGAPIVFVAFIFGVIFGIFVKGILKIILAIILAVLFLAVLNSFLIGDKVSPSMAAIIVIAVIVFAFLIRIIGHGKKVKKYDRFDQKVGIRSP